MNNDAKKILEFLKKDAADHKVDLRQGTFSTEPASKQLHQNKINNFEDYDLSDFFLLVTKVNKNDCEVIPGSLNGIMAGPYDIVLPKDVLGKYIFISPELKTSVPIKCLSDGFAALDDETYNAVITQCDNLQNNGKFENSPFSEALPYISDNDDRIAYHNKLQKHVKSMQQSGRIIVFRPNMIAKAAGFIFVGALITFAFGRLSENNVKVVHIAANEQKAVPEKWQPTQIFRGASEIAEAEVEIYSPKKVIFHDNPVIQIGGKADKIYKLAIINKHTSEKIISADIKGQQKMSWRKDFLKTLKQDETYMVQVCDGEKTYSTDFWLADNNCRKEIQNEFGILNNKYQNIQGAKIGASTIAMTAVSTSKKVPNKFKFIPVLLGLTIDKAIDIIKNTKNDVNALKAFEFAKILEEKGCYSDAFVIIDNILKKHPENKEYKEFRKKCIEKLR